MSVCGNERNKPHTSAYDPLRLASKKRKAKSQQAEKNEAITGTPGSVADVVFENVGKGLEIRKVETSKDKIEQPPLAAHERMIIPKLGSCVILCGKSGSGKSTLLQNLLTDARFFGPCPTKPKGWFDKIFLFAPTGASDDILRSLGVKPDHVFDDPKEFCAALHVIQESQKKKLKGGQKAHTIEQFAVIFEDVIGETEFMNTREFKKMFYMVRHLACTTFLCTQHWTRVPRICRFQGKFICFFAGSAIEVEKIAEEFAPPKYTKKEFMEVISQATAADYDFLTINMHMPWRYRFRHNLGEFIHLTRLEAEENKGENEKKMQKPSATNQCDKKEFSDTQSQFAQVVKFRKQRDAGKRLSEQADRVLGEWAHKGARGRVIY